MTHSKKPRGHEIASLPQPGDRTGAERPVVPTPEDALRLLEELRIHQVELERQNEELRRTQEELEASRARYFDLYELAPVGYLTLEEKGLIIEANLTAAGLLGVAKAELLQQPWTRFIQFEDQDTFCRFRKQLDEGNTPKACELRMVGANTPLLWVRLEANTRRNPEGKLVCTLVLSDVTERKLAEELLRVSEQQHRIFFELAGDAIFIHDEEARILEVNPLTCERLDFTHAELLAMTIDQVDSPDEAPNIPERIAQLMEKGQHTFETVHKRKDGSLIPTEVNSRRITWGGRPAMMSICRDITRRKNTETYKEMGREILRILNEPGDIQDSIQSVLAAVKTRTGFDAVGIRLQDGEDFPYFVQEGFSTNFLQTENTLIERALEGGVCRDPEGHVRLECTCGLVLCNKTNPSPPPLTPGGSFWTNDSLPLLDLPPSMDPRLHPRNLCIHKGYASVALVPIRNQDRIVGLIQFNDRRKDCFTLEIVEILEGIASHIGSAMLRKRAEAALRASEARYQSIIEDQSELICRYRADGRLSFVNGAYARYYGIGRSDLIEHCFTSEIFEPDLSRVATRLAGITREDPLAEVEHRILLPSGETRWQQWTHRGIFAAEGLLIEIQAVGRDITERKKLEETHTFLNQCTSQGGNFFTNLSRFLAEQLGMDFVCIDRLEPGELWARTVAIHFDGRFEENISYALQDTPCGDLVGQAICCFPSGVRDRFPKDAVLQEMKAESYMGTTLWRSTGEPIGLIAVIGRSPMMEPRLAESVMRLVSVRASSEMERQDAEAALHQLNEELENRVQLRTAELRQALLRLHVSEEKFRTVADFAYDWEYWRDPEGQFLYASPSCESITGYPSSAFQKDPDLLLRIIHPEDGPRMEAHFQEIQSVTPDLEFRIVARDGEIHWIGHTCQPILAEDGTWLGQRASNRDITESVTAKLRLWESEQRYRSLYESMRDAFVLVDLQGKVLECNQAYLDLLGYSLEELRTLTYQELTPKQWHETEARFVREQLMCQGYTEVYEKELRRKDGTVFPVNLRAFLLRKDTGEPTAMWAIIRDITEAKRADRTIRESLQAVTALLGAMPDVAFLMDAEGIVLAANEGLATFHQRPLKDLIGTKIYDLLPPEIAKKRRAIMNKALRTGVAASLEDEHQGVVFLTRMVPIPDLESQVSRVAVYTMDITDFRKAEGELEIQRDLHSALRESNEALLRGGDRETLCRAVCEAAVRLGRFHLAWVGILDSNGRVSLLSSAGSSAADLEGMEITTDALALGQGPTSTCIRLNQTCVNNCFVIDSSPSSQREKTVTPGLTCSVALPLREGGRCMGAITLFSPEPNFFTQERVALLEQLAANLSHTLDLKSVSEREQEAGEALRQSERQFRALAESAPILIRTLDARGQITYMNQAYLDFHGLASLEAAQAFDWRASIHPEDLAKLAAWSVDKTNPEAEQTWEYRTLNAAGEYRWLFSRAVPVYSPSGGFRGLIGSALDITTRKQHEENLRNLEGLKAKSQMAAYIAHEINNPLAGIKQSFQILAQSIPAEHVDHPFVDIISRELERIASIVRMAYSIHRPGLPQVRDAYVADILADLASLLVSNLRPKQLVLELPKVDRSLKGRLHEDMLRQILFNVIQNAIEASPPGGRIRCRASSDGSQLTVEVEDEGGGIALETAPNVFMQGFTTKSASETGGLGMGLSTCRSILESVDGSIGFRNLEPGPGTCFCVQLPWQISTQAH